ncbi:MAG: hypothetical protein M3343_10050 [Actinomycetota bacterium]|nr:hypothetical protein [Actinomycetota bacterium]
MATHEQSLVELRNRLEVVLGATEAATLMEHLPSGRPATEAGLDVIKTDLGVVKTDLAASKGEVDRRFDTVDHRFDTVDHRFEVVGIKLEKLEKRLDERIDARAESLEDKVRGAFSGVREDFATLLNLQTRVLVFSSVSTMITLVALILAFVDA